MVIRKRMVCLANSRKLSGRCIAGVELSERGRLGWVRPVSDREHEEVSERERQYPDGSDPRVLDIMEVPLLGPWPHDFQSENWLLDPEGDWQRVGRTGWNDLQNLVDPDGPLWINGDHTFNGFNDKIDLGAASTLNSSLRLIRVESLGISVFRPGEAFGNSKRRVQGRFHYHGDEYRLWITDPVYERRYLSRPDDDYETGESFLTISVGEPYGNACYKLIAAVIEDSGEHRP